MSMNTPPPVLDMDDAVVQSFTQRQFIESSQITPIQRTICKHVVAPILIELPVDAWIGVAEPLRNRCGIKIKICAVLKE